MSTVKIKECAKSICSATITKFEKLIDAELPKDYRSFLLENNGGQPVEDTFDLPEPINDKISRVYVSRFYSLYPNDIEKMRTKIWDNTIENEPLGGWPIMFDNVAAIYHSVESKNWGKYSIVFEHRHSRLKIPAEFLPIGFNDAGDFHIVTSGENHGKIYFRTTNWRIWNQEDWNCLYFVSNSFLDFVSGLAQSTLEPDGSWTIRYRDGRVVKTVDWK